MNNARWRQIDELFGQALEVDPSGRDAFLNQHCGDDDRLRRAVERLLDLEVEATSFLSDPLGLASAPAQGVPTGALEGSRIGPYRLLRPLGHGGMGSVYLARREDDYRQEVAIKLVRRGLWGEDVRRRLRQERQILARLEHPNIARLYDGGTTDEGWPFLVMEKIDGLPIDRYCDRHRLTIRQRLELFREVCATVEHAHRRFLVHCDLKPSNILVTAGGVPKLLDFGIAKWLRSGRGDDELTLTRFGPRPITPGYASPEQVLGQPITIRSDVYSLGVLLYKLLCGQPPYPHIGEALLEAMPQGFDQPPVEPSQRLLEPASSAAGDEALQYSAERRGTSLQELAAQLRGDLDAIVLKALQCDPADRYATVEEFERDIGHHLELRPVSARRDLWRYRSSRILRRLVLPADSARRRERWFWASTLAGVVVVLALVSLQPTLQQSTADPAVLAASAAAGHNADTASPVGSAQHLADAREARRRCDYRLQRSAAVRAASGARLLGDEVSEAEALLLEAEALDVLGRPHEADQALSAACEIFERTGHRLGLARAVLALRNTADEKRRPISFDEALEIFRRHGDREGEALTLVRMGRRVPADQRHRGEELVEQGLAVARELGDLRIQAEAWNQLATLSYGRENLPLADERFATAVRLARASGDASLLAGFMFNWSGIRGELGDRETAAALVEEAVEISRRIGHRYLLVMGLPALARARQEIDADEALALFEEAHDLALEVGDPRLMIFPLTHLARELERRGEHELARVKWQRLQDVYESMGGYELVAWADLQVAASLRREGRVAEAETRTRALAERFPIDDEHHEHSAFLIRLHLVECVLARNGVEEARELLATLLPRVVRKTEPGLHREATRLAVAIDEAANTRTFAAMLKAEEERARAAGNLEWSLQIALDQGRMSWYAGDEATARARFHEVESRAVTEGLAWLGEVAAREAEALAEEVTNAEGSG